MTFPMVVFAVWSVACYVFGFCLALHLVGYGVRGGFQQIGRLHKYRTGKCTCYLCRPGV
jgi:hypothetical protein